MFEFLLQGLTGDPPGIQERTSGIAFLDVAKSLYPIEAVGYLGLNIPLGAARQRYIHCTYSDQWTKHCVSREPLEAARLAPLLPVLVQPLDWGTLPATAETDALLRLAGMPSVGGQLLSFPLRPIAGEAGILCISAALTPQDWQSQMPVLLREFQVLGGYFHQHILRIYGHDAAKDILMSARELDCLKWMAAGKTAWEASVILGISERTVRFHLNAAREKLNCLTTTQAVAKAVSHQLI